MKNKWKSVLICFLMAAVVLLEPVSYALADDTQGESNDRNDMPGIYYSRLEIEKKSFFDWFGLKDIPEENVIEKIVFTHRDIERFDYSLYDLICDFEFKTLNDDGSITTSFYSENINFNFYLLGTIWDDLTSIDLFNTVNSFYDLGTKEFIHQFNYKNLIKNAEGFEERSIEGTFFDKTYNTVVSRLDFYFVRKSDGKRGIGRSFVFTWDSDFWKQLCTKIDFSFYSPEDGSVTNVESVESESGVNGYSTYEDDEFIWKDILVFFTDLPAAIIAFLTGFINLTDSLKELIFVVFPFIPPGFVIVLMLMIAFILIIALYKLVQGWFG